MMNQFKFLPISVTFILGELEVKAFLLGLDLNLPLCWIICSSGETVVLLWGPSSVIK